MSSKLKAGPISAEELMKGLVNAKKVMNKVNSGDYSTGNVDPSLLIAENDDVEIVAENFTEPKTTIGVDVNRIQQSKLPEPIKQAMMKTPIQQITLNETTDIFKGAKRLMEKENIANNVSQKPKQTIGHQQPQQISSSDLVRVLTPIIENVVRKTIDEILDKKLDLLLNAQKTSTINENLVLKVGNSVFSGKITGAKTVK